MAAFTVAERLLGRMHLPAVRQTLGCLIPAELHPSLDGRQRRGKARPRGVPGGVKMRASHWQVSVFEEQVFAQGLPLPKDLLEFFLCVLREVCQVCELLLYIGHVALGTRVWGVTMGSRSSGRQSNGSHPGRRPRSVRPRASWCLCWLGRPRLAAMGCWRLCAQRRRARLWGLRSD